jgi:hypothetical protein
MKEKQKENKYLFTKKDIHSQFNLFWSTLSTNHRDMFVKIAET